MPNMTETPHQTKSAEPTPEQLMQLLDLQIASQRAKRKGGRKHRATLLAGGLLFILAAAFAALFVLQQLAGDLHRSAEPATAGNSETYSH
jgi:hypothetical protein